MSSFLTAAVEIAREAGAVLQEFASKGISFELKAEHDLVTEADRTSERLIVERLSSLFPTHGIVAEEGGGHKGTSEYEWFVDPLDGTTNFAHGFPVYNVTLGLAQAGKMIAGVVFDPTRNEMFEAERGSGAFLNGNKIKVSRAAVLADSLVSTGFPSAKRHENVNIHFYYQLALSTHGVRRCGAAAIDLAYVACGRAEAFWEFNLKPWDMAAGTLLVEEAGGAVSDMAGNPYSLKVPHLLVDNGLIHAELLDMFSKVFRGEFRDKLPQLPHLP